jgi:hypothetical protein
VFFTMKIWVFTMKMGFFDMKMWVFTMESVFFTMKMVYENAEI